MLWTHRLFAFFAGALLAVVVGHAQATVPLGWRLYPGIPPADSAERNCAARTITSWRVRIERGQIQADRIERYDQRRDELPYSIDFSGAIDVPPPAPPNAVRRFTIPEQWARDFAEKHARRRVMRVPGGWLVGFDAGEYGGSLWWYPATPGTGRKLSDGNVRDFLKSPDDSFVLVLVGLEHITSGQGHVLWLQPSSGGGWTITRRVALRGAPYAYAAELGGAVIVATSQAVQRVGAAGEVDTLAAVDWSGLEPNSVVLGEHGDIVVGLRFFVTALRPSANGYRQDWYIPPSCALFNDSQFECSCIGGR